MYNGACFPCKKCKQSHRNSVHHDKQQFGYHEWESQEKEEDYSSFSQEAIEQSIREMLDDVKQKTGASEEEVLYALADTGRKFMGTENTRRKRGIRGI